MTAGRIRHEVDAPGEQGGQGMRDFIKGNGGGEWADRQDVCFDCVWLLWQCIVAFVRGNGDFNKLMPVARKRWGKKRHLVVFSSFDRDKISQAIERHQV